MNASADRQICIVSLRKHAHAIYREFFQLRKMGISLEFFYIFAQNIDCGYTLELPWQGSYNKYLQSMFLIKNKENRHTPVHPRGILLSE